MMENRDHGTRGICPSVSLSPWNLLKDTSKFKEESHSRDLRRVSLRTRGKWDYEHERVTNPLEINRQGKSSRSHGKRRVRR